VKIGGLQKVSLIDFPGKIAAVVFTQGCNFRCPFCHNESLVIPKKFTAPLAEDVFFDFLKKRIARLDGVVVSGGEPTLQGDLPDFLKKIKNLGFLVKLDSNGTRPDVFRSLLDEHLLDYIAMDIKHKFESYGVIAGAPVDLAAIKASVNLLKGSGLDYEFRTTVVPAFHGADDVMAIAQQVAHSRRFCIQEFVPNRAIDRSLTVNGSIFAPENHQTLENVKHFCEKYSDEVVLRGIN
jgi:pyruvate formate lyase activating enzyme